MGCPVNKITKNGGGSSLLREPKTAELIVRSVVNAVDVPVTVKLASVGQTRKSLF
jgi:tRNA-dihydrouridine synthase